MLQVFLGFFGAEGMLGGHRALRCPLDPNSQSGNSSVCPGTKILPEQIPLVGYSHFPIISRIFPYSHFPLVIPQFALEQKHSLSKSHQWDPYSHFSLTIPQLCPGTKANSHIPGLRFGIHLSWNFFPEQPGWKNVLHGNHYGMGEWKTSSGRVLGEKKGFIVSAS